MLNLQVCFQFLFLSFLIGALLSLIKMLHERNLVERLGYFLSYVREILCLRSVRLYHSREVISGTEKIHFAGPVFGSVILLYAGHFL